MEPWGEERADLRVGTLSCIVANLFRGKGKKAYSPSDFFYKPKEKPTWQMMLDKVKQLNSMFRGKTE